VKWLLLIGAAFLVSIVQAYLHFTLEEDWQVNLDDDTGDDPA
jgi:hypothetical protein